MEKITKQEIIRRIDILSAEHLKLQKMAMQVEERIAETDEIDFETMELFYIERDVICEELCNIERTIESYNRLLEKINSEVRYE